MADWGHFVTETIQCGMADWGHLVTGKPMWDGRLGTLCDRDNPMWDGRLGALSDRQTNVG